VASSTPVYATLPSDLHDITATSTFRKRLNNVLALFRRSLATGRFLSRFKDASITSIVKKMGLDPYDASSYRPISNLAVLSKLLERLVARQLMDYLTSADILPSLQFAFARVTRP